MKEDDHWLKSILPRPVRSNTRRQGTQRRPQIGAAVYNKLFTKILDSSIWLEPMPTRIVWLTFIAVMDETGFVQFASIPNAALRARVPLHAAEKAIECLESPDPLSADPENDGRRIEKVPGGWMVLNAEKYRDLVTRAVSKERVRERVARHRASKRNAPVTVCNDPVTQSEADTDTHTEAKTEREPRPPQSGVMGGSHTNIDGRAQRRHGEHASPATCAIGACVHASQHDTFTRRLSVTGGKGPDGRTLREWYVDEADALIAGQRALGDNVFQFWDNRLAVWLGTVSTRPASTKGARTMEAGNRLQAALDAGAVPDPFGTNAFHEAKAKQLAAKASA